MEIENLSIAITASADNAASAINKLASSMGGLKGKSRDTATAMQPLQDTMEHVKSGTQSASEKIQRLAENTKASKPHMNAFVNSLKKIKVPDGLKKLPGMFGNYLVSGVKSATSSISTLFSSLQRIAFYRFIRSAIKFITQGFKEGIENLYNWSKLVDTTFANSMDKIATASLYAKNSLAAMASPLIEALAPAIDFAVDRLVELFNTVNQVFAKLTGSNTYTVAKKVATVWDDSTSKTTKNIKKTNDELKRTILGFDEINKLVKDKDPSTGSSSGSKKKTPDYKSMFETRVVDSSIGSFVDQIRRAIDRGDWKSLGTLLGRKINEIINSIDFAGAGRKVGYFINGWFSTKYWTLKTINFTKIGRSIATFLNNAISQINFNTIGRYFVSKLTVIVDAIIGFFGTFNFGQLASVMSDFVIGMLQELTEWLEETDWTDFGKTLADKLVDVLVNIKWGEIASAFFGAMNAALMGGLHLLGGFFDELASRFKKELNWDTLTDNVKRNVLSLMEILGGAALAVGAILAFSGHLGLGIAIMAAGAGVLATKMAMNESVNEKIEKNMNTIMNTINTFAIVIGTVLAFSGHIPLGLAIIATNAGMLAHNNVGSEQWGAIQDKIDKVLNDAHAALYADAAIFVIGAILAFSGIAIPIGIAMMIPAAIGIAKNVGNENWGTVGNKIKGIISTLYDWITGANEYVFVIGLVLALSGVATPLGIAIMAGNFLWGAVENLGGPQEIINKINTWWGDVKKWWDGLGDEKLLKLGLAFATTVRALFNQLKTAWDKAAYNLTIGLIPRLTGTTASSLGKKIAEKLGFGSGMAGSLGEHFFGGANVEELSVDVAVNAMPGSNAQVTDGSIAPKISPVETAVTVNAKAGLGLTVNSSGKPILAKLPEGKVDAIVTLTKNNWSTVVDWVTQARGGDVQEGVELVKSGWTQIDKWAEQYKGGKLDQKISLIKAGWSLISGWVSKYMGGVVKKAVDLKRDGWTWVDAWVESFSGGTVQQGISLFVDNWNGFLNGVSNTLHSWFPNLFADGGAIENGKVSRFARGGYINAYAGGTARTHGSLFLAGEAGPEIVGHVGGRTEVLNKSQLAATMYEAVRGAMAGITIDMNMSGNGTSGIDENMAILELIGEGNAASQREIELLREQNNILRQLLEKPNVAEVSTTSMVNALQWKNKRDGTTVVQVNPV